VSALHTSDAVSSFARVLFVLVGTSLLSSCLGRSTYRWNEEVQLHDGRVIVIERSVRTGEVPVEIGQPPGESDYTLTFKTCDGKSVTWEAGTSFNPMILDLSDEVPYVVAEASPLNDYAQHDCSRPPYFFFRYRDAKWERVSYEEFPRGFRRRNLLSGATYRTEPFAAVKRGSVTLADVQKSHFGLDNYYKEVREDRPMPSACLARGKR